MLPFLIFGSSALLACMAAALLPETLGALSVSTNATGCQSRAIAWPTCIVVVNIPESVSELASRCAGAATLETLSLVPHKVTASGMHMRGGYRLIAAQTHLCCTACNAICHAHAGRFIVLNVVLVALPAGPNAGHPAQIQLGGHAAVLAWQVLTRNMDEVAWSRASLNPVQCNENPLPVRKFAARAAL
jgi:hypothetical protein